MVRANPIPATIVMIAGDVLNNLRSTLDHLAQQLYLVGSGGSTFRDQTSFPIAETPKKFKSVLRGKVEGTRQDAIDAIRALEPYTGGKGADLWTFHRLNNIDKHRMILTLSTDHLRAKSNASCPDIEREARKYAIAEAILVGWCER
jgi:hypothetical protein